jgi:CRP-like cAMP-binding protein
VDAFESGRSANRFLAALPPDAFSLIEKSLKTSSFARGTVLFNADDEVNQVYFPHRAMISLVAVMQDGTSIETATVGREGAAGFMTGLGQHRSFVRAVVQMPGIISSIPALKFRAAAKESEALRNFCTRYNEVLLLQAQVTAACNSIHSIEHRFCRWILQSRKAVDDESVPLTQEFMAQMLGVRRSSVSEVAGRLQKNGSISYARGRIRILDQNKLEKCACECYATINNRTQLIWPPDKQ